MKSIVMTPSSTLPFWKKLPRWVSWTLMLTVLAALVLVGIDLWTGAHGFFLLWFFGLKADD
jgi:hypothetical protein